MNLLNTTTSIFMIGRFDDESQLEKLVKEFGVSDAHIAELKAGKVEDVAVLHKEYHDKNESSIEARIKTSVETKEMARLQGSAFETTEKLLLPLLTKHGVTEEQIKDLPQKGRTEKYITMLQTAVDTKFTEKDLELKKKSPDVAKMTQLNKQLETANSTIETMKAQVAEHPNQIAAAQQTVQDDNYVQKTLFGLFDKYGKDNKPEMRMSVNNASDILRSRMNAAGLKWKVTRDAAGNPTKVVPVNAEGAEVAIGTSSKNHDIESYLNETGAEREFFAKSNAGQGGTGVAQDLIADQEKKVIDNLTPKARKQLEDME